MEFKVQIVMPIVETPIGSVSLNPDGYSIDSFDALKFVELNKHTIHIHDAFIAPSAMRCMLTIAKDMINIMTAEFDAVGAMDTFTVDLIHNDAGFDETYNWNPHIAEIVLTHKPSQCSIKAKLYAVIL